jgi:hypothetical protein
MHVSIQRVNKRSAANMSGGGGGGVSKKNGIFNILQPSYQVRIGDMIIRFYNDNKTGVNDNSMRHSPSGANNVSASQKLPYILQEPTSAPCPKSRTRLHPRTLFI